MKKYLLLIITLTSVNSYAEPMCDLLDKEIKSSFVKISLMDLNKKDDKTVYQQIASENAINNEYQRMLANINLQSQFKCVAKLSPIPSPDKFLTQTSLCNLSRLEMMVQVYSKDKDASKTKEASEKENRLCDFNNWE